MISVSSKVHSSEKIIPQCYGYTIPNLHTGYIKIGYTGRSDRATKEENVRARINDQVSQVTVGYNLEWYDDAIYRTTEEAFKDTDFHACLEKNGFTDRLPSPNGRKSEWFRIGSEESKQCFDEFREGNTVLNPTEISEYNLREEQQDAINQTCEYFNQQNGKKFLWNAKPRFGKTLTAYSLCKALQAKTILIVTNRPSIANSWYNDYEKFLGEQSGYYFVSSSDELNQNCKYAKTYDEFIRVENKEKKCIYFVSLQKLKSELRRQLLKKIRKISWDLLIIDEAHEGVETIKTDEVLKNINRKYTLYLSGTPFKAIADECFRREEIFNWTYTDEQKKKREWDKRNEQENPYADFPQLNMFTYQISEIVRSQINQGIEIDGKLEDYFFNLNAFFATKNGEFIHAKEVEIFLDALTKNEKFPFSTSKLRGELRHTFWLLNRIDSVNALAKKLKQHPVFENYEIISVAGDGILESDEKKEEAFNKVRRKLNEAIKNDKKTITLSVGKLTTGVTIPEWTGILMLSSIESAEKYIQTVFRVQNPWIFKDKDGFHKKTNGYVFDFEPTRTLKIMREYATGLKKESEGQEKDVQDDVKDLLNYFPVYGENNEGQMIKLDAEKVLTIPCQLQAKELFNRGFCSRFLFKNLSRLKDGSLKEIIERIGDSKNQNDNRNAEQQIGDASEILGSRIAETTPNQEVHEQNSDESKLYAKLESLSQKIPALLMGYGDDNTTAENFAEKIKDQGVFEEVTGISKNDFNKIRDQFFDNDILNGAIKEFMKKKYELRNYLDGNQVETIFDYIPSIGSNQIFTPQNVVKEMVNNLKTENSGCFGDDTKTYIDLYMKSGLYIAEIVKRLFKSKNMKKKYSNEQERLKHIFEHQVYGCAPTKLLHKISLNYLLGDKRTKKITKHNLIPFDTLLSAQEGNLETDLNGKFPYKEEQA